MVGRDEGALRRQAAALAWHLVRDILGLAGAAAVGLGAWFQWGWPAGLIAGGLMLYVLALALAGWGRS